MTAGLSESSSPPRSCHPGGPPVGMQLKIVYSIFQSAAHSHKGGKASLLHLDFQWGLDIRSFPFRTPLSATQAKELTQ